MQVGSFVAHSAWVTGLSWAALGGSLLLATGCSQGSVRLHAARTSALAALPHLAAEPAARPAGAARAPAPVMQLRADVTPPDLRGVTCLDLHACSQPGTGAAAPAQRLEAAAPASSAFELRVGEGVWVGFWNQDPDLGF